MDALLLLAPTTDSTGYYTGRGDFAMLPDGRLQRRGEREVVPFIYAGAAILAPALFEGAPSGAFGLTQLFDRAGEQRPAVRPAARRRVDACRNPRGRGGRQHGAGHRALTSAAPENPPRVLKSKS